MFDLTTYVKKWRIRQLKTVFSTLDTLWWSCLENLKWCNLSCMHAMPTCFCRWWCWFSCFRWYLFTFINPISFWRIRRVRLVHVSSKETSPFCQAQNIEASSWCTCTLLLDFSYYSSCGLVLPFGCRGLARRLKPLRPRLASIGEPVPGLDKVSFSVFGP